MKMRLCAAQLLNCDVLILMSPLVAWMWITSGCSRTGNSKLHGSQGHPYHVRGDVPGDEGAQSNKEQHIQRTSVKYIIWRLRVTTAVDEVSGRSVEYRQLCPSVWVEKDILFKMATSSWSSWKMSHA